MTSGGGVMGGSATIGENLLLGVNNLVELLGVSEVLEAMLVVVWSLIRCLKILLV